MRYETKNGVEYASVYKARREDGKKVNDVEYLGRVIDKDKGIFCNKKRGIFQFSLDGGAIIIEPAKKEKLILDFGDCYFLSQALTNIGFLPIIKRVFGDCADSLASLVFYKSLLGGANCYAESWWEGSYARIIYPDAKLLSQRISEALSTIGDERVCRKFFNEYLQFISNQCGESVLVDSSGLPNDIKIPITAKNNHNGVISNEARLIYVVERESKLPVYFRYVAGNCESASEYRRRVRHWCISYTTKSQMQSL